MVCHYWGGDAKPRVGLGPRTNGLNFFLSTELCAFLLTFSLVASHGQPWPAMASHGQPWPALVSHGVEFSSARKFLGRFFSRGKLLGIILSFRYKYLVNLGF